MHIELEIYENKMVLTSGKKSVTVIAEVPYSTDRLLVGNFNAASECLRNGAMKLGALGFLKRNPEWTIFAKELVSKEISQIEDRIFRELVVSVGARRVRAVSS